MNALPEITLVVLIAVIAGGVRLLRKRPLVSFLDSGTNIRPRLLASCILLALISIPMVARLVPPNGVYGFRNAETLSNPAIWYAANAFAGWALLAAAAGSAVLLIALPDSTKRWIVWVSFLAPVIGAFAASQVYLQKLG
jgi:cytosine/uracil/thiamine/allantoin permease